MLGRSAFKLSTSLASLNVALSSSWRVSIGSLSRGIHNYSVMFHLWLIHFVMDLGGEMGEGEGRGANEWSLKVNDGPLNLLMSIYLFIYLLCHIYPGVPHQCAALFSCSKCDIVAINKLFKYSLKKDSLKQS